MEKNELYIKPVIFHTDRIESIVRMTISELFATCRLKNRMKSTI